MGVLGFCLHEAPFLGTVFLGDGQWEKSRGAFVLHVDPRAGSAELAAPLRKMGFEVDDSAELPFGDVAFQGRGNGGKPVSIGIEFKKIGENVASLRSGRLCGHQLPGMRDAYDFSYLLVEGELLYDKKGQLLRRAGRRRTKAIPGSMGVNEYLKRVLVLHLRGGLNPWHTITRQDTLKFIETLYRVWNDCDLDQHGSHLAIYQAPPLVPISPTRMALSAWPTIGFRTSKAVEDAFGSVAKAATATEAQWAAIEIVTDKGQKRRLGAKDAARIVEFLKGR